MSELTNRRPSGLNRQALRTWGMLGIVLGAAGSGILQNGILNLGDTDAMGLLQAMEGSSTMMGFATLALVLQAICCCAAPIFAFLLTEGFSRTSSRKNYFLRVLGLALVSELPYNLAVSGTWLASDGRNPVFALALALVMLYFYCRYPGKRLGNVAIKTVVTVAAFAWAFMLRIDEGPSLVLLVAVLWLLRGKPTLRVLFGCVTAFACSLFSPFYLASPMAFLAIHFYNGEKGEGSPWVNYLSYPAILLIAGLLGTYFM